MAKKILQNNIKKQVETWVLTQVFSVVSVCLAVGYLVHTIFFSFAPFFWGLSAKIPPEDYADPLFMRLLVQLGQQDGIEPYILYLFFWIFILISGLLCKHLLHRGKKDIKKLFFIIIAVLLGISFVVKVKFTLPYSSQEIYLNKPVVEQTYLDNSFFIWLFFILVGISGLGIFISRFSRLINIVCATILLTPLCFIAVQSISVFDYTNSMFGALCLYHEFNLSQIFFLYDFLHSLIPFIFLKLGADLNLLQIVAQASYFVFFVGMFWFALTFFRKQYLAWLMLITMIIVRMYGLIGDIAYTFQGTPLRFDWWLLLAFFVYARGKYHWLIGCILGVLLCIHKLFGIIYVVSYVGFLALSFSMEVLQSRKNVLLKFKDFLQKSFVNVVLVVAGFIISQMIFGNTGFGNAEVMRNLQVGMTKISPQSFYWYVPVILSVAFVLGDYYLGLQILTPQYYITLLFVVIATIGNSLYFFGRSDETNITSIVSSIVFTLFIIVDIVDRVCAKNAGSTKTKNIGNNQWYGIALALIIVVTTSVAYSKTLYLKGQVQIANLVRGRFIYPMELTTVPVGMPFVRYPTFPANISIETFKQTVKEITHNSTKVYFYSFYNSDFWYCYYGGYKPANGFPQSLIFLKKDLAKFVQKLLDDKYYIVFDSIIQMPDGKYDIGIAQEIMPMLSYSKISVKNGFMSISKE